MATPHSHDLVRAHSTSCVNKLPSNMYSAKEGKSLGYRFRDLDLDLDNSRQEPEAITATSGCALRKSGEPTLEGRYCVGLSN